jgi:nicotinamidase-related amidase
VLLLMDYQEAMCRPDGAFGSNGTGAEVVRRQVLVRAAAALAAFRAKGYPVVHARLALDEAGHRITSSSSSFALIREYGLMRESDPATAICHEVAPADTEPVVAKGAFGPFAGTNLEQLLHRLRPTDVVMGGVATNHVVESAARYASDVGFPVVVLEDLCAADREEAHRYAVEEILPRYASVTSSEAYFDAW